VSIRTRVALRWRLRMGMNAGRAAQQLETGDFLK